MASTPISALPFPISTDPPTLDVYIENLARAAEKIGVLVFTSSSDRTTKLPSPTVGNVSYRTDTGLFDYYTGATNGWQPLTNLLVFTGSSDRSTRLPSPPVGAVSFRTDTGLYDYYTGATKGWQPLVSFMVFADATDRSTRFASPTIGALSYRTDTSAYESYTGVTNGWQPLIGYSVLPRSKSIRPTPFLMNVASTTATAYTGATFTFPKLYAASTLRLYLQHSAYVPTGSPVGTELVSVVSFNGTDSTINTQIFNVVQVHQAVGGTLDIGAGVAAGSYAVQVKYKLVTFTGTQLVRFDADDQCYFSALEFQAV